MRLCVVQSNVIRSISDYPKLGTFGKLEQAPLGTRFFTCPGRLLRPMGMKTSKSTLQPRVRGMQLTLLAIVSLRITNLVFVGLRMFGA